jgi:hypothetical protein
MRIVSLLIVLFVLGAVPAPAVIVRSFDTARAWNAQDLGCGRMGDIPVGIPCCAGLRLINGTCAKPAAKQQNTRVTGIVVYDIPIHKGVVGACYNGARKCEENALLMCKDHEWKVAERCAPSQVCVSPRGCLTPSTELRKTTRQPITPLDDCARWKPYASAPRGCPQDLSNTVRWSH